MPIINVDFTEQELHEIQFALFYADKFNYDTIEFNHILLIAKLARYLQIDFNVVSKMLYLMENKVNEN